MSRQIFINGETMVYVKGCVSSSIASLSELGLAEGPIIINLNTRHDDVQVDAWGNEVPVDEQIFLADATITMNLVHFDPTILNTCIQESMGGAAAEGRLVRAGTLLGGGVATRFAAGNHYIGLNLASPVGALPYRFYYAYMAGNMMSKPMGTKRSVIGLNWRAIPYTSDPWQSGSGAAGAYLYDHTLDS